MNKKILLLAFLILLLIIICFSIIKVEMFENHGTELNTHTTSVLNSIVDMSEFKLDETSQMNHTKHGPRGFNGLTYMRGLNNFLDRKNQPTNLVFQ